MKVIEVLVRFDDGYELVFDVEDGDELPLDLIEPAVIAVKNGAGELFAVGVTVVR